MVKRGGRGRRSCGAEGMMINNKNVTNIELPRMGDVDFGNPRKLYSRYGLCPPTRSQKRPSYRPSAGAFYFTAKWNRHVPHQ